MIAASSASAQTLPAKSGPNNNAVNSPGQNNSGAPVAGRNSFTEGQAKSKIEEAGYTKVSGLKKDTNGVWRQQGVLGGVALGSLLKFEFARPRPDMFVPAAKVFTASFPSDHATLSAITYLTLAAVLAKTIGSPAIRNYFMAVAMTLTALVGVSRIYLGVH